MVFLPDTNVLSFAFWGQRGLSWQSLADRDFQSTHLSRVALTELKVLSHFGEQRSRASRFLDDLARECELAEVSVEDWSLWSEVKGAMISDGSDKKLGNKTGYFDLLIACQASLRGYILVTDNIRDFEHIANYLPLSLENWVTP